MFEVACFLIHHSDVQFFVLTGYSLLLFILYRRAVPFGYPVHIIKHIEYRTYIRQSSRVYCQSVKLAARCLAIFFFFFLLYRKEENLEII
jgi:hypothetical protein